MKKSLALFALFFVASVGFSASAHAATITRQVGVGSTGASVTALQTLLATSHTLYPAGLITGYYGPMTQTAVMQFQIANNITPTGYTGPITLAKLQHLQANNVMVLDPDAPLLSNVRVSTLGSNATITWNTSEMSFGKVHYDVTPITMYDSNSAMTEPLTSGTVVAEQSQQASHSVTLVNLNRGQNYYYSIESEDATGNVSVAMPAWFTMPN